jgi:hypothetical protein
MHRSGLKADFAGHPTSDRLTALRLTGMARALDDQRRIPACDAVSFEERLGLLVDREAAERDSHRLVIRAPSPSRSPAC